MSNYRSIDNLLEIMQALRNPQTGCSWDTAQTFETIIPYTIEEAYEVAEAIARNDMSDLCDELGDLLLQVVYHAQIATEQNHFSFDDVVTAICEKMIRRHPHVFGSDEQIKHGKKDWEEFKQQERAEKSKCGEDTSVLANVDVGLPPLVRARKLQKKAAKVNFDWPDIDGVLAKLQEEFDELEEAVKKNEGNAHIEEEIGDILFSVINFCRHVGIDADIALQKSNSKFENRFRMLEDLSKQQSQQLGCLSEKELDALWEQAKKILREC
jgi:ATP diphosphatase